MTAEVTHPRICWLYQHRPKKGIFTRMSFSSLVHSQNQLVPTRHCEGWPLVNRLRICNRHPEGNVQRGSRRLVRITLFGIGRQEGFVFFTMDKWGWRIQDNPPALLSPRAFQENLVRANRYNRPSLNPTVCSVDAEKGKVEVTKVLPLTSAEPSSLFLPIFSPLV